MQITKQQLLGLEPCSMPDVTDIITLDWALENISLKDILWVLSKLGYKKEIMLFAVFCSRQNEHLLSMKSIYAINVVERFAHGMSSIVEVNDAANAAYAAYAAANATPYIAANAAASYAATAARTYADNAYATNAAANVTANAAAARVAAASAAAYFAGYGDYVSVVAIAQKQYLRSLFI